MIKKRLLVLTVELSMKKKIWVEWSSKEDKGIKKCIALVKEYEDLSKEANRNIINIVDKQGELLKKIRDSEEFFWSCWSKSIWYLL